MNKINKTQEIRTFVEREGGLDGRVRAFVRSCVRARVRACVPAGWRAGVRACVRSRHVVLCNVVAVQRWRRIPSPPYSQWLAT